MGQYAEAAELFRILYEDPRSLGAEDPNVLWNQGRALYEVPARRVDGLHLMGEGVAEDVARGLRGTSMPNFDALVESFDAMPQDADELLGPLRVP
jgi:hypothetical protein